MTQQEMTPQRVTREMVDEYVKILDWIKLYIVKKEGC